MRATNLAIASAALSLLFIGCQEPAAPPAEAPDPAHEMDGAESFAAPIEKAHALSVWREKDAFASDIVVRFGGDVILEGRMLMTPSMSRTRLDLGDGTTALWDGEDAWVQPADAELPRARFHVLTWPYFLSAPMKLRDPGTELELLGERDLRGERYEAARLTFEAGVGDTPDDWYVVYRDPDSGRLAAMAYIVTFGTSQDEAEREPHAITYGEHVDVEGVPIPTRWTFWAWSEEKGIEGEPIGEVTLSEPRFLTSSSDAFLVPEGARKEELPGTGPGEGTSG